MAGLNPDGLGRNRSFDDTESESLKTEHIGTVDYLIRPVGDGTYEVISDLDHSEFDPSDDVLGLAQSILDTDGPDQIDTKILGGDYTFASTFSPERGDRIRGAGIQTTTLERDNGFNGPAVLYDSADVFPQIEHMRINGDKENTTSGSGIVSDAEIEAPLDMHMKHVFSSNWPDHGFLFDGTTRGYRLDHILSEQNDGDGIRLDLRYNSCRDMHLDACYLSSNDWGMQVLDSAGSDHRAQQHNWVIHAKDNASGGLRIKDVEWFEQSFVRVIAPINGGPGVELGTGAGNLISRNIFVVDAYNNTGDGLIIGDNCAENIFIINTDSLNWSDSATRNVVNGHAKNSGDPRTAGTWNGSADKAFRWGAIVWDTSKTPWGGYHADANGDWIPITEVEIDAGTGTHTTGSPTTIEENLGGPARTQPFDVVVYDDPNGTQPNADYSYSWTVDRQWDEANTTQRIDIDLTWNTDPGSNVDIAYRVLER